MREARKTVSGIEQFKIGPDNPTKASFLDQFAGSGRVNGHSTYTAMTVFCEEFNVFLPSYDEAFLSDLSAIFDNPETYNSPRRSSKTVNLQKPTLNILACATPAVLSVFPEIAWNQGFTSRVLFIYSGANENPREIDMFEKRQDYGHGNLVKLGTEFFNELSGEFEWDEDAQEDFNVWRNGGMKPKPDSSRLLNYNGRRAAHVLKLAMISAVSAGHGLNVTLSDFHRARAWLLEAEKFMPDMFHAMTAKSDDALLRDLHYVLYAEYSKIGLKDRRPIKNQFLVNYLRSRVPSERIDRLIKTAEAAGLMHKDKNSFEASWIPSPNIT